MKNFMEKPEDTYVEVLIVIQLQLKYEFNLSFKAGWVTVN